MGGEIKELYKNDLTNNTTHWESEVINVVSSKYLTWTVYCDADYDIDIEWSVDPDFTNVIDSERKGLTGDNSETTQIPVKAQYVKFIIDNIASTPNHLISQGFFFTD